MIAASALLLAAAMPANTPTRLPPFEDCRGDSAFDGFRAELSDAVARRDVVMLRPLVADNVLSSFGGNGGWDEFASAWGLGTGPAASKLWPQLEELLKLGCAPTQTGGRVFPSLFQRSGEDTDPFDLVVARPGAVLRSAPTDSASSLGTLDWHSARLAEEAIDPFVKVALVDGRDGWLNASDAISPLDYRLVAERRDGRWMIAALVAGD